MFSKAAIYIIIIIYQFFETILYKSFAVGRMHLESSDRVFSKHLYLNNAPENSDLYHYRNLLII